MFFLSKQATMANSLFLNCVILVIASVHVTQGQSCGDECQKRRSSLGWTPSMQSEQRRLKGWKKQKTRKGNSKINKNDKKRKQRKKKTNTKKVTIVEDPFSLRTESNCKSKGKAGSKSGSKSGSGKSGGVKRDRVRRRRRRQDDEKCKTDEAESIKDPVFLQTEVQETDEPKSTEDPSTTPTNMPDPSTSPIPFRSSWPSSNPSSSPSAKDIILCTIQ